MAAQHTVKLTYFNLAARGFPIRVALRAAGVAFEDERIAGPELAARRGGPGKFSDAIPLGQLPVVTIDGRVATVNTLWKVSALWHLPRTTSSHELAVIALNAPPPSSCIRPPAVPLPLHCKAEYLIAFCRFVPFKTHTHTHTPPHPSPFLSATQTPLNRAMAAPGSAVDTGGGGSRTRRPLNRMQSL